VYQMEHYNLDMILSVGCRVLKVANSKFQELTSKYK